MFVRYAKTLILLLSAYCWKEIWLTDKPKPLQPRLFLQIFNQCSLTQIKSSNYLFNAQTTNNMRKKLTIWCKKWLSVSINYLLRFFLNWPVITHKHLQQEQLHAWEMWFTMWIEHKIKKTTSSFQATSK